MGMEVEDAAVVEAVEGVRAINTGHPPNAEAIQGRPTIRRTVQFFGL
jgi:hypothetical protein